MSFPAIQPRVQPVSQNIILPNAKEMNYTLEFDGSDDYVEIPNFDIFDGSHDFTIEFYYKQFSGGYQHAINFYGENSIQIQTGEEQGVDILHLKANINDEWGSVVAAPRHDYDTWYHIAISYDSSNGFVLYVDGNEKDTNDTTGNIASRDHESSAIGYYLSDNDGGWDGTIDEVRIWDTARTQQEIQDNMNKELNGDESGLVAYYKMNEGSGDTLIDSAGSNDGQIIGATWKEV